MNICRQKYACTANYFYLIFLNIRSIISVHFKRWFKMNIFIPLNTAENKEKS